MAAHRFPAGGRCIWCGATPEKVADRRAPPFCVQAPDEIQEREYADSRDSANDATGY